MTNATVMNVVGWCLTVGGAVSFVAAAVGIAYTLIVPDARVTYSETSLHDTYYVVSQSRTLLLPLVLAAVLSAAVALIGYSSTAHYIQRALSVSPQDTEKA